MLTVMRQDLTAALKARDRVAVAALRSALAAVENAAAVRAPGPTEAGGDHVAGATTGVGSTEVQRREQDGAEIEAIVRAEVRDRRDAAEDYERLGRSDEVVRLRAEAEVLSRYLGS